MNIWNLKKTHKLVNSLFFTHYERCLLNIQNFILRNRFSRMQACLLATKSPLAYKLFKHFYTNKKYKIIPFYSIYLHCALTHCLQITAQCLPPIRSSKLWLQPYRLKHRDFESKCFENLLIPFLLVYYFLGDQVDN